MGEKPEGRSFWPDSKLGWVLLVFLLFVVLSLVAPDCGSVVTPRTERSHAESILLLVAKGMAEYEIKTGSPAWRLSNLDAQKCLNAEVSKLAADRVAVNHAAKEPTDWETAYYFGPKPRFPEFGDKVMVRFKDGTTELMSEERFRDM